MGEMDCSSKKTTSSQEDYLEAVFLLEMSHGSARVSDIAEMVGVGKSAASLAVKALQERGFVLHDSYGRVRLTPQGREIGEKVSRRHFIIRDFLHEVLGVPMEEAESAACGIEHVVSALVIQRFSEMLAAFRSGVPFPRKEIKEDSK